MFVTPRLSIPLACFAATCLFACNDSMFETSVSGLAEYSKELDEVAAKEEVQRHQTLANAVIQIPSPTVPVPPGVDADLWKSIGWLPGDALEISRFSHRQMMPMVNFAEGFLIEGGPPECKRVLDAVAGYYMVEQGGSGYTLVHYGSMERTDFNICLEFFGKQDKFEVKHEGAYTSVPGDSMSSMGWGKIGSETIFVLAPTREAVQKILGGGGHTVASSGLYGDLLARVDQSAETWIVARRPPPSPLFPRWGAYTMNLHSQFDPEKPMEIHASGVIEYANLEIAAAGKAHFQRIMDVACEELGTKCSLTFSALPEPPKSTMAFRPELSAMAFDARIEGEPMAVFARISAPETLVKIQERLGVQGDTAVEPAPEPSDEP